MSALSIKSSAEAWLMKSKVPPLGHTQSGKPVYSTPNHKDHKDFSDQDHKDAAAIHMHLSTQTPSTAISSKSQKSHFDKHFKAAREHSYRLKFDSPHKFSPHDEGLADHGGKLVGAKMKKAQPIPKPPERPEDPSKQADWHKDMHEHHLKVAKIHKIGSANRHLHFHHLALAEVHLRDHKILKRMKKSAHERLGDWLSKSDKKIKHPAEILSHADHFHADHAARHEIHAKVQRWMKNHDQAKKHRELAREHASKIQTVLYKNALLKHYRMHHMRVSAPAVSDGFAEHSGQKPKKTW